MPISWNEIKSRALAFSKEWENETSEDAEAKSFWDGFFNVFGISRRRVATFEKPVKKGDNKQGFIDLLWKGVILVEHKSRGKDLDKAFKQATEYFPGLKENELPQYILVSDFDRFCLHNLDNNTRTEFHLNELVNNVHLFGFIAGYQQREYKDQDPVNIKAAELMGKLHDRLKEAGYVGHSLERYLVRLLFCLFADDTGIFEKGIFWQYLDLHTKPDGSDLAMHLASIFQILNTPKEARFKNVDENLDQFPYVNGRLFEEHLPLASFSSDMRTMLLDASALDWGNISPAIFGSMFQSVMNPQERRNLGAHYTSEKNIQKVIKPLFLDDLQAEFEKAKGNKNRLNELHDKLSKLRFLDPACGCGNFLIISYRELRELEISILRELNKKDGTGWLSVGDIIKIDVDQFYGIEYDEFPAMIAEVAMWLIDHQMNLKVSNEFGQYFVRLPLRKAAQIKHGNALQINWTDLVPNDKLNYILGNPPFIGKQLQNTNQKADMSLVFSGVSGAGVLDYVAAWYLKASQYIQGTNIKCAFVSTNSIAQGEQVGILWSVLFKSYKIKIHFAHRTFSWKNEARGNAAVHVVIIGFAAFDIGDKKIYDYLDIKGEPQELSARNINPYLVEGNDIFIQNRRKPLCDVPEISYGSMANDGGYLLLTDEEKTKIVDQYPDSEKFIRPFLGSQEFINAIKRWCIWLVDIQPSVLRDQKEILDRVGKVKEYRLKSTREATRKLADYPMLFAEMRQPQNNYLLIPGVSSENRKYIPIGFMHHETIASDLVRTVDNANLFIFGMITSLMHMIWVKYVGGKLKSDYRYSNGIVYNNYPFPKNLNVTHIERVEKAAQGILDARNIFQQSSLADLYDPIAMPPELVKAHQALDKAVDLCYRPQPFTTELNRIEFLFALYEQYDNPLLGNSKRTNKKR